MTPIIVLIGRSNVGKSTLFNRLTHTRDALVNDFPGLTRDRQYGYGEYEGHRFIVVDTGGIDNNKKGLDICISEQSFFAIEEADIIFFIVDCHSGLVTADYNIAKHIRNRKKSTITIIIANKTDGINADNVINDFYSLGMGEVFAISASHGRGINSILNKIILPIIKKDLPERLFKVNKNLEFYYNKISILKRTKEDDLYMKLIPIKLAIVGRPNSGKSTLTNFFLGEKRVVVYDLPGTTRDSVYIPMIRNNHKYVLIDTAGVRQTTKLTKISEKFSIIKTLESIKNSNVVLLIIDANIGISNQDMSLLKFILHSGRSIVIAVNKSDCLSNEEKNALKKILFYRLKFVHFVRLHFISALYGNGINSIFNSVNEAYYSSIKKISTACLTRMMHIAIKEYQPPIVNGRRIKPKYAHAGGYNPPVIIIHGTQVNNLPDSYNRYLVNYFRSNLDIIGSPIQIQFNETKNPFSIYRRKVNLKK